MINKYYNFLFNLEKKYDLFNKKINNIYFWEIIRLDLLNKILTEKGIVKKSSYDRKINLKYFFNKIFILLKNILLKNLFFSKSKSIFIFGHPRREKVINNIYYDIYTDFIKEDLLKKGYKFQDINIFDDTYYKNISKVSKNILTTDFIDIIAFLYVKFSKKNIFTQENENIILKIEKEITDNLGIKIDLLSLLNNKIKRFHIFNICLNFLFKIKKPKLIIEVVGYELIYKSINNIAKKLNIPTIELEHGVISKYHFGYSIGEEKNINTKYFPDYLFTWGDYWSKVCNYPKNIKVISTGFPFFEMKKNNLILNQKEKNILVISQGTIGEQLAKEIFKLAKELVDFNFYYKLHPGEFYKVDKEFKYLKEFKNIKVISNEKNIYELFSICKNQIGVYSTSIYEGLGFGLKTIVFNFPGIEYMQNLIDKNYVKKVDDYEECKSIILNKDNQYTKFDKEIFFKSNSLENISNKVKEITK